MNFSIELNIDEVPEYSTILLNYGGIMISLYPDYQRIWSLHLTEDAKERIINILRDFMVSYSHNLDTIVIEEIYEIERYLKRKEDYILRIITKDYPEALI